jgi:sec-independent protein translocase protein TatB
MAQAARTELKSELGDTLGDFDIADLNPRAFVRKHLLDDLDTDLAAPTAPADPAGSAGSAGSARSTAAAGAAAGQAAPFDADAT